MNRINLDLVMPEEQQAKLSGRLIETQDYDLLLESESAAVYKPNGQPLAFFLKGALPKEQCAAAYYALRGAARESRNRGVASGGYEEGGGFNKLPTRADGRVSKTSEAPPVDSGIAGYFDRYIRIPYCRQTAFNMDFPEKFAAAIPLLQTISNLFKEHVPERWANQNAYVQATSPDFRIPGTVFTTVTVNKNFRTATHKDAGDLACGFGNLTVLEAGSFTGGHLVFPAYRVAARVRSGDLLLMDVHEWHGNTPLVGRPGHYERISLVLYYRERMWECGSMQAELDRAKNRQAGQPLYETEKQEPSVPFPLGGDIGEK